MTGLLGQTTMGAAEGLVNYRFARLEQFDDPRWMWAGVAAAFAAGLAFVIVQYRREAASLPYGAAVLLTILRVTALAGLILFYLDPIKRTDTEVITESRVAVLTDVSQSMTIEDADSDEVAQLSRASSVAEALRDGELIRQLRAEHDVSLAGFDESLERIGQWSRLSDPNDVFEGAVDNEPGGSADPAESSSALAPADVDWTATLAPRGVETRLGDALSEVLRQRSGGPLAGILLFSDGGQNAGLKPLEVGKAAAERGIPIFTIGVGSAEPHRNVRVQDIVAPSRAYPGDKTVVRVLLHAEGFQNRSVEAQLFARLLQGDSAAPAAEIGSETAVFESDAEAAAVEFTLEPTEVGRLELEVRLKAPSDDRRPADNVRTAEIEIVETSTRVLLIASGATREYRFLRNQLRRDRHSTVDVWLQMALPGISQDADAILDQFPQTKEELFEYDCIVAFDPDWTLIDARQVDLLEQWVADQAGGLILSAGPVHTSSWVQSAEHAKIRALYPVEFQRRLTLLDDGLYGSLTPWPIEFSRAGREATFLSLGGTPVESQSIWEEFTGVYGCYAVKGPKPGAQVYGRYSDPEAGLSMDRPVYMAEQFYGAGRVFYLGSGEMWRLRRLDPAHFEVLYTQLIRHVTQGRLLRGSSRGMLLVGRDNYRVGDDVTIRAQLNTNAQQPYLADRVTLRATGPDGVGANVPLLADANRAGNFVGQMTVFQEGAYRLELPVPDALDEQLTRRIQVAVPDLEFESTARNVNLLAALARQTGGLYYENPSQAVRGSDQVRPVGQLIESQAETKTLEGKPDVDFTRWLRRILLGVICGALLSEWLLRRLLKLA